MEQLVQLLTELISRWHSEKASLPGAAVRMRKAGRDIAPDLAGTLPPDARAVAEHLVRQAIENGLELGQASLQREPIGEGSTAELVERLSMSLRFVFKLQSSRKLVDEARVIRLIRENPNLPRAFRERFPRVFTLKDDQEPYAYLMEEFSSTDGYRSLAEVLFKSPLCEEALAHEARRLIGAALGALFEGYAASMETKRMPNVEAVYLGRIEERLGTAEAADSDFASAPLTVNALRYEPWREYLVAIRGRREKLLGLAAPFTCVVHGDAHPENILIRYDRRALGLKLIDPKEWGEGDYLFDITKLAHYLEVTGPVEQIEGNQPPVTCERQGGGISISYDLKRPAWTCRAMELLGERIQGFARGREDLSKMKLRYELGMASNLLGLPAGRLGRNRSAALVFYGEGMRWLDLFARNLERL